jgi:hypothetical protein
MISREELERIWNKEPVGWLKQHIKNNRGKSAFTIVARPYIKQYLDTVEITVYAKTSTAALNNTWELSKRVQEKYPSEQYKDIGWTYGIKSMKKK